MPDEPQQATPEEQPAIREEHGATREARGGSTTTIAEITLADEPQRWEALGFAVCGEAMWLGDVRVILAGSEAGHGILGWSLRGTADSALDGLPTTVSRPPPLATPKPLTDELLSTHPNGVMAIDHVVAKSPNFDRGIDALQAAGLDVRRIRD